ncbi:MAG: hypothetical protein L0Y62_02050 [Nitrospirae bacterium]|nr:hypothetical protein [Nitrospirota bacterium]
MQEDYEPRIYEFGGPEHLAFNEIIAQLMEAMNKHKPIIHIPLALMNKGLPLLKISRLIGGVIGKKIPPVTAEQLALLQRDNICDRDSIEKSFGFKPIPFRESLKTFI